MTKALAAGFALSNAKNQTFFLGQVKCEPSEIN